jgi:hypothetical protein
VAGLERGPGRDNAKPGSGRVDRPFWFSTILQPDFSPVGLLAYIFHFPSAFIGSREFKREYRSSGECDRHPNGPIKHINTLPFHGL